MLSNLVLDDVSEVDVFFFFFFFEIRESRKEAKGSEVDIF